MSKPTYEELEKRVKELEKENSRLKEADERLKESEEHFRNIFDGARDGILYADKKGIVLDVNHSFTKKTGISRKDIIGKHTLNLIKEFVEAKDVPWMLKLVKQILSGVPIEPFELEYKDKILEVSSLFLGIEKYGIIGVIHDITKRKKAEEALRENEKRYRTLCESSRDGIATANLKGFITECNKTYADMLGYSREELKKIRYQNITPSKWHEFNEKIFQEVMERGYSDVFEKEYMRKDGTVFPVSLHTWRIDDKDGNPVGVGSIIRDITEHKQAENTLRERIKELNGLYNLGKLAEQVEDLEELFHRLINDVIPASMQFPDKTIAIIELDKKKYCNKRVNAYDNFPHLSAQIIVKKKQRGILTIGYTEDLPLIEEFEQKFVDGCADRLGKIIERKETEETLRESEERFRALTESTSDWIWEVDTNVIYTYTSPKVKDILGYSPKEIIGTSPFDFMPPEEAKRTAAKFRAIAESRKPFERLENINLHKDGRLVVLETSGVPIFDIKGQFCGYRGIDRDVSKRKKAEEALQESEERLRLLVESAEDIILMQDTEGKYLYYNGPSLYGMEHDEVIGKTPFDFHSPENATKFMENLEKVVKSRESMTYESQVNRGREKLWFIDQMSPIKDSADNIKGVVTISRNITERKKAEDALKRSELELAIRNRISNTFLTIPDAEMYGEVLQIVLEALKSEYGVFGYIDENLAFVCPSMTRDVWWQCNIPDKDIIFPREKWGGIWGRALIEKKSIYSNEPLNVPKGHIPIFRAIDVPIIHRGEVIGNLLVGNKATDYDERDQELLETIANHIAPVLQARLEKEKMENKRKKAEQALKNAHNELELRVKERTAEHRKINEQLKHEIIERELTEEELKNSREQLRDLSTHLHTVREEERRHIAREIHDELGKAMTVMKMDISWLENKLPKGKKSLFEKTNSMSELINETIQTLQRISAKLRPSLLDDLGLTAAIEWQIEEFRKLTGIKCKVNLSLEDIILKQDLATAIFRIFQETLTNIARHANATKVKVSLQKKDGNLELEIKDNGKGITEKQISDPKSFGLIGIRERIYHWRGEIKITGTKDKGTTVSVNIPLHK